MDYSRSPLPVPVIAQMLGVILAAAQLEARHFVSPKRDEGAGGKI